MAFGGDFAGTLGKRRTASAGQGGFGDADTAGQETSEFNSFIETLGQSKTRHGEEAQW
jgi:hypothetical protein